jgi:HPt (histidine-containing phosphotransfer) domain-containing protein
MIDRDAGAAVEAEWSPERLLDRLGGDRELAVQLAGIFVSECPRMLEALRQSIEQGVPDQVRRAAHALKGSVLNFVDQGPAATAFELETRGRTGELNDVRTLMARLERETAALVDRLNEFHTSGSAPGA